MSKTHIAVGLLTGIAITKVAANYNFDYFEYVPGIILGSTMPDIDTGQSWVSQVIPYVDDKLRSLGLLKHRGLTHGFSGIIAMIVLYFLIKNQFMLGFGVGYICHCLLDMVTDIKVHKKKIITTKHDNAIYKLTWVLIVFISFIKF
jgi:membrane-bound metal-dependent hydrolase YbcI (DUF457 family)